MLVRKWVVVMCVYWAWMAMAHAKTPPSVQPPERTLQSFSVSLQEKTFADDVLHVTVQGRHATSKNKGLRLKALSLVPLKISDEVAVYRLQGHYQQIFGKESADYLREGVPFAMSKSFSVPSASARYVVQWDDEQVQVFSKSNAPKSTFKNKH